MTVYDWLDTVSFLSYPRKGVGRGNALSSDFWGPDRSVAFLRKSDGAVFLETLGTCRRRVFLDQNLEDGIFWPSELCALRDLIDQLYDYDATAKKQWYRDWDEFWYWAREKSFEYDQRLKDLK